MNNKDIENAIENLKAGKVGIFPTDTAYGIGCRMDDENAVKHVYKLRNRPEEKALLILVSSVEMAEKYVEIPEEVRKKLIEKYWPGGLTIILNCKTEKVPGIVRANGETLAVRFPYHIDLQEVIDKLGVPIVAPSANFSGESTPVQLNRISPELISKVDFILPGMCTMEGVSTIVDTTVQPWKIMREGVVRIEKTNF